MDYLDAVLNGQAQSSAQIVNAPVAASGGDSVTYTIHVRGASGTPTGNVRLRLYGRVVGTGDLYGAGNVTTTANAPISGNLRPLAVYDGDRRNAMAQASPHESVSQQRLHSSPDLRPLRQSASPVKDLWKYPEALRTSDGAVCLVGRPLGEAPSQE